LGSFLDLCQALLTAGFFLWPAGAVAQPHVRSTN
jgi:hypothetical protein